MNALPKFNRHAFLALWAQNRRRKRARGLLPAPVLSARYPDLAVWSWNYPDPVYWYAYHQHEAGEEFTFDDRGAGSDRQYAPDGGQYPMFIVGCDADGNPVTQPSNVVIPQNALLPGPVLAAAYPDLAVWSWDYADPVYWYAYHQHADGEPFTFDDRGAGTDRQYSPDGGQYPMFIVGCDADGNPVTEPSNVVVPQDAALPVNLTTGLKNYWMLDEAEDPRYDQGESALDLTALNYPVGSTAGKIGDGALFNIFDGDENLLGDNGLCLESLDWWDASKDLSVSLWFNFTPGCYSMMGLCAIGYNMWLAAVNTGYFAFLVADGEGAYMSLATFDTESDQNPAPLLEGYWYHVVLTKSGDDYALYVCGYLMASGSFASWGQEDCPPFCLGGINDGGYPLNGVMDEVGLWQRALSADEVGQLYNNGDGLALMEF